MIYDITLTLSPELVHWPGDAAVEVEHFSGVVKLSRWAMGSHAGTHVDAPAHFSRGPRTVDQLDPAVLLGRCRVLRVPDDVPLITAKVLQAYDMSGVERLLLRTRNSKRWETEQTTFDEQFVALDDDAARLLVARGIKLVGVDGLSVAPYRTLLLVHETLLDAGIVLLEGVNLSEVPAGDYGLICAPLKLLDGDGAPARVFLVALESKS